MNRSIFVNLPVKDLNATKEFFAKLGFSYNKQFTNEDAACMVLGEKIFVMLLVEKFFKTFIDKEIADTKKTTEMLIAISADSKGEIDSMIEKVIEAGGCELRERQDLGFMYSRTFGDLDGHIWEILWMDPTYVAHEG
ncbi:MAG: VOC family protein [bacterium]|nr:VOC family protein [bacterium]